MKNWLDQLRDLHGLTVVKRFALITGVQLRWSLSLKKLKKSRFIDQDSKLLLNESKRFNNLLAIESAVSMGVSIKLSGSAVNR